VFTILKRTVRNHVACALIGAAVVGCSAESGGSREAAPDDPSGQLASETVRNGGFEQGDGGEPVGWFRDQAATGRKGSVRVDREAAHAGDASLRLDPNERNDEANPLAVSQLITPDGWHGRTVEVTASMRAEGGAVPILGVLSLVDGAGRSFESITPGVESNGWNRRSLRYRVPEDPATEIVIVCMVNGRSGSAWFDGVSLRLLDEAPARPEGAPGAAAIRVDAGEVLREIPQTLFGTNVEWRWNANELWDPDRQRPDPEILRLTREMGVTLIRFPGGVYSDSYHWRDGVGPPSERPEVRHEPGSEDRSVPYFGADEALVFADSVGAELLITVNAGTGTPEEAADWVRYVNRDGLRVRYWEVGNELYIDDGSVFASSITVDPQTYASRFLEFAAAMREADPRISIGAIGGENRDRYEVVSYPDWNPTVLREAGHAIDFLSVHNAYAPIVLDDSKPFRTVYRAMLAAPEAIARNLETLTNQIEQHAPDHAERIFIAVTEWGPFFQVDFGSRYFEHTKTLGSAIFSASAFKTFLESPNTKIANFWALNDMGVLGWIASANDRFPPDPEWIPTARYHAFRLYTQHFGSRLIRTEVNSPTFDAEAVGFVGAQSNVAYLESVSSLSEDGQTLYMIVINKHFDAPISAEISLAGFSPADEATLRLLTGESMDANTGTKFLDVPGVSIPEQAKDPVEGRFDLGAPDEITVRASTIRVDETFTHQFPARSVSAIEIRRRAEP
jgi:alpha-N-arabinofuranosidase